MHLDFPKAIGEVVQRWDYQLMEEVVLQKQAGLEKWLRSRKQPVRGLACHVCSQPQKWAIYVWPREEGNERVQAWRPLLLGFQSAPSLSWWENLPGGLSLSAMRTRRAQGDHSSSRHRSNPNAVWLCRLSSDILKTACRRKTKHCFSWLS